jgi:hypothetical protein
MMFKYSRFEHDELDKNSYESSSQQWGWLWKRTVQKGVASLRAMDAAANTRQTASNFMLKQTLTEEV